MITKRNLALLPDIDELKALLQSLAMLDAVMSPEWQYRYYSFNAHWAENEQMGSMRNGQGDDFFTWFGAAGCFIRGFAHESYMTPYANEAHQAWAGVLDEVPTDFAACHAEPAFRMKDITFAIWRRNHDCEWQDGEIKFPDGEDPDGFLLLLGLLDGKAEDYQFFAEEYYEETVPLPAIEHIYKQRPLTEEIVRSLNPQLALSELEADIAEIGYPQ